MRSLYTGERKQAISKLVSRKHTTRIGYMYILKHKTNATEIRLPSTQLLLSLHTCESDESADSDESETADR